MKIPFLNWTEEQNFSDEAKSLFNESGECYKASAYRAALLFSFLGFQTVLKDRILESRTPKNYQSGEWSQLQNTLLEDDSWDATVIKIVNNKKKSIFSLNDDLINQYMYWKNRRNDCAHAKGNEIGDAHVEAYWLFLKSNSMKFRVNGSKEYILEQIKEFYDPNITPPNASIKPLVSQIPHSIDKKDLESFFQDLKEITASKNYSFTILDSNKSSVWFELLDLDYYSKEIIKFLILKENDSFAAHLISLNPSYVMNFQGENSFIRYMWNKFSHENDYKILLNLIKNNLIPNEELEECFTYMFENVESALFSIQDSFYEPFNEFEIDILKNTSFFEIFYSLAFKQMRIGGDFNWGNRNKHLVIRYLEEFKMDNTIAVALNNCKSALYPPWHLNSLLNDFFERNSEEEDKYNELLHTGNPIPFE